MLFNQLSQENRDKYLEQIKNMASLSRLFADDTASPFLVSRAVENIYCNTLEAINLGRDDTAIDAVLDNYGIGIKTFLHNNGRTFQKIAEFNKDSNEFREISTSIEKVKFISKLRNERLTFAKNNYFVTDLVYHCITRTSDGIIYFYEQTMDYIDIDNIQILKESKSSIVFFDGINEYNFNLSKSTLLKRFNFVDNSYLVGKIEVSILEDPFSAISEVFKNRSYPKLTKGRNKEAILLPLYSEDKKHGKFVPEKSGLNQWNANGRKRNVDEVYIPIRSNIHKSFPNFFPSRDCPFSLHLPNRRTISAKVCQDNDKALMSNPNKDLGEWLLRSVLNIPVNHILTYDKLREIGVDSVSITKHSETEYSIDFCEIGSYEEFAQETLDK